MIILDTNVLSELMRSEPSPRVRAWVDQQRSEELWTTSISAMELCQGVARLDDGERKDRLTAAVYTMLNEDFAQRIANFDLEAALATALVAAERLKIGRPVEIRDSQIAGIAISRNASISTRNVRHFSGLPIELINPWDFSGG
ncbi:MAG: type II toxin-antitoxin system VapC family toxin [Alphaproteobacteria bacterium]|nr:type II toxin-antitoxin system VapC family toxin [Alphaproteobacteria bacterium]MBM3642083.1 type II toxin-antitoxin system VapC family toxin [Alphaproteobacteria bacterium]